MGKFVIFLTGILLGSFIHRYISPKKDDKLFPYWRNIVAGLILAGIFIWLYSIYQLCFRFFVYTVLMVVLFFAALTDLSSRMIPNILVFSGSIIGILFSFFNMEMKILDSILGGILAGGILMIISIVTRGAVGKGDAKLFACIGTFLGIQGGLASMVLSTFLSGLAGLVLLTLRIVDRKSMIPFAPFIMAGTLIVAAFFH